MFCLFLNASFFIIKNYSHYNNVLFVLIQCQSLIETYGKEILDELINGGGAKVVCTVIGLCLGDTTVAVKGIILLLCAQIHVAIIDLEKGYTEASVKKTFTFLNFTLKIL